MRKLGLTILFLAGCAMILQASPVKAQLLSGDSVETTSFAMYCKTLAAWKLAEDLLETNPTAMIRLFPNDPGEDWICRSGLVGVAGVVKRSPTKRVITRKNKSRDLYTIQVELEGGLTVFGPHASFKKVR